MNVRERAKLLAERLEKGSPPLEGAGGAAVRPLYDLGQQLRQVPAPELDTAALIAGTVRVRETLHARRPGPAGRPRWLARLAWAALALLLALAVTTTGTALAAESSLPGEPLYPVKRAGEAVRLALAWEPQRHAALRVELAERRLAEVVVVCVGGECPPDLLDDLGLQTLAAQEEVERLLAGEHHELLDRMVALTNRQQEVLTQVLTTAPDAARPGLERALERSQQGHARARQALGQERDPEEEEAEEDERERDGNVPLVPPNLPPPAKSPLGPPQTLPGRGPRQP